MKEDDGFEYNEATGDWVKEGKATVKPGKTPDGYVTATQLNECMAEFANNIGEAMAMGEKPLADRLALLEQGLAKHAGIWTENGLYKAGSFSTRSGALWHCSVDNPDGPPGKSSGWTLVSKSKVTK
jgi:hypothetical protein